MDLSGKRSVPILLSGLPVGQLSQERHGGCRWLPEARWVRGGQVPRLSFDFLRDPAGRRSQQELPPWFENLLPERESALRARLAQAYDLREGQSYRLLLALGAELPGAVAVGSPEDSLPESSPREAPDSAGGSPPEPHRFSSLAGMQLKCSMSMINERLAFGVRSGYREWIVKFPGNYPDLVEVEVATMDWARRAGLDVPVHQAVPVERLDGIPEGWQDTPSASVFAIARFDRREDGSRIHHEDLCQALGLRPMFKYGDGSPGIRFEGVLRFLVDACGEEEGREFARRLGFMIACGNTDAHLKNWGLLWGDRLRPVLTPCYDLVSTISWEKMGWMRQGGPRLALWMATTHRFADLDDELLERFTAKTGAPWAEAEVRAGMERARDGFGAISVEVPARMREALREHWRRVPLLRAFGPLPG